MVTEADKENRMSARRATFTQKQVDKGTRSKDNRRATTGLLGTLQSFNVKPYGREFKEEGPGARGAEGIRGNRGTQSGTASEDKFNLHGEARKAVRDHRDRFDRQTTDSNNK